MATRTGGPSGPKATWASAPASRAAPTSATGPSKPRVQAALDAASATAPSPQGTSLSPAPKRPGGASVPAGPWSTTVSAAALLAKPLAEPILEHQRQSLVRCLTGDLPARATLVKAALTKRLAGAHGLYRGVADWRAATLLAQLSGQSYVGRAGFVLNSQDGHAYQPSTVRHAKEGQVMSIGDSDRVGFAPYDLELRSWLASLDLESRQRGWAPSTRQEIMRAFLDAYREGIEAVATAVDPEQAAKALRVTADHHPEVLEPLFEAAADSSRKKWLEKMLDEEPLRFAPRPGKLALLPEGPASDTLRASLAKALPQYMSGLDEDGQARLAGLELVDVALPIKGNGSLGYGRYLLALAPPDGDRSDAVILELKEQLPTPTDRLPEPIDQAPSHAFGVDQATRAVSLFRLGTGRHAAEDWGQVELPGAGVESSHFTVKPLHGDEQGMDLAKLGAAELKALAAAQGHIVASFQALGAINGAPAELGGAPDIRADMASKPSFVADTLAGAVALADATEAAFVTFTKVFGPVAAAL